MPILFAYLQHPGNWINTTRRSEHNSRNVEKSFLGATYRAYRTCRHLRWRIAGIWSGRWSSSMAGWSKGYMPPCDIVEPTLSRRSAPLRCSWRTLRDSGLLCGVRTSCRCDRYIPSRGRASHPNNSSLILVITAATCFARSRAPCYILSTAFPTSRRTNRATRLISCFLFIETSDISFSLLNVKALCETKRYLCTKTGFISEMRAAKMKLRAFDHRSNLRSAFDLA